MDYVRVSTCVCQRLRLAAAVLALALSVVFMVGLPSAYGAYAYNYGWDWSQSPFNDFNYYSQVQTAASSQSARGYTAKAYSYSWADQVSNNLPYLSVFYMRGHASEGNFGCYHPDTRTWPKDPADPDGEQWESNISAITSDISLPGAPMLYEVNGEGQPLNHYRRLADASASSMKIAVFTGCKTSGVPSGGHSLTYSAVYQAGAGHSVGFAQTTYASPGYDWSYRYWDVLRRGYNSLYSLQLARDYVYLNWGQYFGFNSYSWYGDPNTKL